MHGVEVFDDALLEIRTAAPGKDVGAFAPVHQLHEGLLAGCNVLLPEGTLLVRDDDGGDDILNALRNQLYLLQACAHDLKIRL